MKSSLKVIFTFTKPLEDKAKPLVTTVVDDLKKKFIEKDKGFSVKPETADNLVLHLTTGETNPAHFIVQLDRQLREKLGKECKIGIRDYALEDYETVFELEHAPLKEIKVPYGTVTVKGKHIHLVYSKIDKDFFEDQRVMRTISLIKDKVKKQLYQGKEEFREPLWQGQQRVLKYNGDPAIDLEKIRWLRRTPAKAQFILGRELAALISVFKELAIEKVYAPLGYFEVIVPKFEPWEVPEKSGHAKNIYPNAYFVSVPKVSSEEFWEEVMDEYYITHKVPAQDVLAKSVCVGMLSYAQCPPFWPYLEKSIIDEESLPLLVYDWSGPTYRNEAGGTHGLDRVEEFHRIETLFIGTKEHVVRAWKDLTEAFGVFFDQVLDLEIRYARVTPWWMVHAGVQEEKTDRDIGTIDFDAYLPYRGDRSKEWLEIQNASSNGDKYPKAFQVKGRKADLWSGCAGGSFERWLAAFLAQKGLDPKNWPDVIRTRYLEKVRKMKTLKFY